MTSRRNFLQQLGLSAAAVPFLAFKDETSKDQTIYPNYEGPVLRVAIMGLGSYGTRVAEAMKGCTKAKLVGAVSGTPSKLKDSQSKYNIAEKNCHNYDNFHNLK